MIYKNIFLFICIFSFSGCYSFIGDFKRISLSEVDTQAYVNMQPIIFYKECTKRGYAWLYICQVRGLDSIFESITFQNKNIQQIENIQMYYFPKKEYIRIEIYDRKLLF